MRYVLGFICVLALGLMGCSETTGAGGSGGTGAVGGDGGTGGSGGTGGMAGSGGTGGMVVAECPPGAAVPAPATGTTPLACRNNLNQLVSEFVVTLDVALDCAIAGEPFNASVSPTLTLDTTFLQTVADWLCPLGVALTGVTVNNAQARIDAVQGATCESQVSELSPVPQDVELDVTVDGVCGLGGSVTVNSGPSFALPDISLRCVADDTAGETVAFCATGVTPLEVDWEDSPVDTWVTLFGSPFTYSIGCGGPATIKPAPGESVACTALNNDGGTCGEAVGTGDFGEEPFPTSDCDFPSGQPFECTTVPVAVDPTAECVTFTLEELGTGASGGAGGG